VNPVLPPVRQKILWGVLIVILVGLGVNAFLFWVKGQGGFISPVDTFKQLGAPEGSVLAVFGEAPDFSLTERSEKTLSKSDLLGKPWIANFIFTSCAGQCPLMSTQMASLQKKFGPETGLRFVSFTVDPERDTPEVLSKYADGYEAEKERWFFLTGALEEMNRILKSFFLSPVDEPAMHSIRFILLDETGQIRGYYDSSDPEAMKQLLHDGNLLVQGGRV
jgi:cytochrome oxidase Cu insertion factor (SCO1/SenC/PrrC family)